jgi:dTDP-4-dehydrorhamnose reductase
MSRVLILGGGGMLGHKAYQVLAREHEVFVTFRQYGEALRRIGLFDERRVISDVNAVPIESVHRALREVCPEVVLNCIGIIKQLDEVRNPRITIEVNALFPHILAEVCAECGARLIHVSTDCVFSGNRGMYKESDESDAHDLYGRTKLLGELQEEGCLTLRTSIIGHELFSNRSLVDWFLTQRGSAIRGYTRAIYSGLPTIAFSREISRVIREYPALTGLYQVAASPISKYDLLRLVREIYDVKVDIIPHEDFRCDRSLDGSKYVQETGFHAPSWNDLILEMHRDSIVYQQWKKP